MGARHCRPTNMAHKRPQNSHIFMRIALDTGSRALVCLRLWALRTRPRKAAVLSEEAGDRFLY
jgi:hypothetical protein